MSYDLMVFNPESVPHTRKDFMEWYRLQTQWKESHGYNNPTITTLELRSWMMEMIQTFRAISGPFSDEDCSEIQNEADYNIGKDLIYVTFSWGDAEMAYSITKDLAAKYKVGFFDVSADEGDIIFPSNMDSKS